MKIIIVVLLFAVMAVTTTSCGNILDSDKDEESYQSAMEQLEEEGNVSRNRRMDLIMEVIKPANDHSGVIIDKEKIGIE